MSYRQYKHRIAERVAGCSPEALDSFCRDVLMRILGWVDEADMSTLWPREAELVAELGGMVREDRLSWEAVGSVLDELNRLTEADEEHAIETDSNITEFLCAMDNWRQLALSRDPPKAAAVSENLMNILDFHFADNVSLEDWLSVAQLRDEFHRQLRFLEEKGSPEA